MRVLIADDDIVSRRVLEKRLTSAGYSVEVACDGEQALARLRAPSPPSLALLDWMMPKMDGTEVCRRVRQMEHGAYLYMILLTAKDSKDDIVNGLEAGADDYITKPFSARELDVRLNIGRRIVTLQDELRFTASHDALTGVFNRGAGMAHLDRELTRSARTGEPLGLLLLDLDHFKRVNDTFGHLGGDEVLREAARRAQAVLRPYDVIARYGGEELMVVLPGASTEVATQIGERLRAALAESPVSFGGHAIAVTTSVGVASAMDGDSPEALVGRADDRLYVAKRDGRNRVAAPATALLTPMRAHRARPRVA
jgi:two-component system cell cycle response regulator